MAKQLHPDRVGASPSDSERFKSITAAYDVLGDERLRGSYDAVRIDSGVHDQRPKVTTMPRPGSTRGGDRADTSDSVEPLSPEVVRRRARRWIAAGLVVSLAGLVVAALIVHLQADERARRAGRVETEAVVVVSGQRTDVRFTTADGAVVRVPEPDRVNPGAQHDGQSVAILYRPDRPTDVIVDESTTARDITLWVVALKLLVGGPVFLTVGIRRLRRLT